MSNKRVKEICSATSEEECPDKESYAPNDKPVKFKQIEESKVNEYDRNRDKAVVKFGFRFISLLCLVMSIMAFIPTSTSLSKEVIDFFKNIILIAVGYVFSRYISDK